MNPQTISLLKELLELTKYCIFSVDSDGRVYKEEVIDLRDNNEESWFHMKTVKRELTEEEVKQLYSELKEKVRELAEKTVNREVKVITEPTVYEIMSEPEVEMAVSKGVSLSEAVKEKIKRDAERSIEYLQRLQKYVDSEELRQRLQEKIEKIREATEKDLEIAEKVAKDREIERIVNAVTATVCDDREIEKIGYSSEDYGRVREQLYCYDIKKVLAVLQGLVEEVKVIDNEVYIILKSDYKEIIKSNLSEYKQRLKEILGVRI